MHKRGIQGLHLCICKLRRNMVIIYIIICISSMLVGKFFRLVAYVCSWPGWPLLPDPCCCRQNASIQFSFKHANVSSNSGWRTQPRTWLHVSVCNVMSRKCSGRFCYAMFLVWYVAWCDCTIHVWTNECMNECIYVCTRWNALCWGLECNVYSLFYCIVYCTVLYCTVLYWMAFYWIVL